LALAVISDAAGTGTAMQILEKAALTAPEIAVNVLQARLGVVMARVVIIAYLQFIIHVHND